MPNLIGKLKKKAPCWLDLLVSWLLPVSACLAAIGPQLLKIEEMPYPRSITRVSVFAAIIAALLSLMVSFRLRPQVTRLTGENANLTEQLGKCENELSFIREQVPIICKKRLMVFSKNKLEFGRPGKNQERISFYTYDPTNQHFVLYCRYSDNPALETVGRTEYPANQGCIGKIWEHGWHFENRLPDYSTAQKDYLNQCRADYNLPKLVTKNLTMKPQLCAGLRLDGGPGRIGLIVVEAMARDRFIEKGLQEDLQELAPFLVDLISVIGDNNPRPSTAAKEGF